MIRKMLATGCLVFGAGFLYFGYRGTRSVMGELERAFTGRYSNETMIYLALGAVLLVAGFLMLPGGKRR